MPTTANVEPPRGGVQIKEHLSIRHFRSAFYLTEAAIAIETGASQPRAWTIDEQQRWDRCAAHAVGATFAAVAGLEAAVNELYINSRTSVEAHDGIANVLRPGLAALWPNGFKRREGEQLGEILRKCDRALEIAKTEGVTTAVPQIADVSLLIQVRNALTHSKEDFRTAAPFGPATEWSPLERELRMRVQPSPLTPDSAMYLWCRVLGGPLAQWATTTAHFYANGLYDALGARVIFRTLP